MSEMGTFYYTQPPYGKVRELSLYQRNKIKLTSNIKLTYRISLNKSIMQINARSQIKAGGCYLDTRGGERLQHHKL